MPTVLVVAGNVGEDNPPRQTTPRRYASESSRKSCRPSERSADWCKNIFGAWNRELYVRVQSTQVILQEVRRAAATQREKARCGCNKNPGKTVKFDSET